MKITIKQIAALTGVSRGTVDKVIHARRGVSDEVRAQVQAAIERLEYTPNPIAKALNYVQNPKMVAVVIPRLNNPYFVSMQRGMDDAYARLKLYGMQVEYFYCDVTNVNEVLRVLDYLEERAFVAIAIRGIRSERLRNRLNALHARGIPVLLLDSDMPGVERLCLVGEDCRKSGRIAASLLAKSITCCGKIAILGGSPEVSAHKQRVAGFEEAMQENYPAIHIVEKIDSLEQSVIAYDKTCGLLQSYPDLKGIFSVAGCTGDIGQAVLDQNKKDYVKIVCYNFTEDVVALVQRKIVEFTIGLMPRQQGALAIETLFQYLFNDEKPKSTFLQTPITIGMDENIMMYQEES